MRPNIRLGRSVEAHIHFGYNQGMVRNLEESELLAFIRERILATVDPVRIVLFGSRARGDARPDSDVDLLVVVDRVDDKRECTIDLRVALRDLPVGKDIIVATSDELRTRGRMVGSVLRTALREGRVFYERH